MKHKAPGLIIYLLPLALLITHSTFAAESLEELSAQVEELQRRIQELQEESRENAEAAEWRYSDSVLHMSGYADVNYINSDNSDGNFTVGNFSPIFHYQYRDAVMLESELELEVNEDGETEVNLEYLTIDAFLNDYMTLVAGKFLSPIGQFRQNLHPSWINDLATAPPGFGHDGAAPVSDVGVQLRGGIPLGGLRANYAVFVSNGPTLKAELEDDEFELDGVEAEGASSDLDGEKIVGGRIGILPLNHLELGISLSTGKATVTEIENGDSSILGIEGVRDYDVVGFDFAYQYNDFQFRGEFVETEVGGTPLGMAASEGATWETWYTQASYRRGQSKWEYVTRYAEFDSPHAVRDQDQVAIGLNYLITNTAILKATYEFNDGIGGSAADDDRLVMQLSYGF